MGREKMDASFSCRCFVRFLQAAVPKKDLFNLRRISPASCSVLHLVLFDKGYRGYLGLACEPGKLSENSVEHSDNDHLMRRNLSLGKVC